MARELTREELRRLARLGARRRLEELRQEEAALRAAFPDLELSQERRGAKGRRGRAAASAAESGGASKRRKRRRPKMTAAQKRAVSERMKKYWAERRKSRQ